MSKPLVRRLSSVRKLFDVDPVVIVRPGDFLDHLLISHRLVQVFTGRGHDDFRPVALFDLVKYIGSFDELFRKLEVDLVNEIVGSEGAV